MEALVGNFKLEKSENFDEFLKATGVGAAMRSVAKMSKPDLEIKKNGDDFEITTKTTFKTQVMKFTLGKEFEEERLDGNKALTTITAEGNKLVQTQNCADGKKVLITREIEGDKLKVVCQVNEVVSTRYYARA